MHFEYFPVIHRQYEDISIGRKQDTSRMTHVSTMDQVRHYSNICFFECRIFKLWMTLHDTRLWFVGYGHATCRSWTCSCTAVNLNSGKEMFRFTDDEVPNEDLEFHFIRSRRLKQTCLNRKGCVVVNCMYINRPISTTTHAFKFLWWYVGVRVENEIYSGCCCWHDMGNIFAESCS